MGFLMCGSVSPHVTVERSYPADNAARQWLLMAVIHVVLYCMKRTMSNSVTMLPQVWKI